MITPYWEQVLGRLQEDEEINYNDSDDSDYEPGLSHKDNETSSSTDDDFEQEDLDYLYEDDETNDDDDETNDDDHETNDDNDDNDNEARLTMPMLKKVFFMSISAMVKVFL